MSHDIRTHKTVEELVKTQTNWEDMDSAALVHITEDGQFNVMVYWEIKEHVADTLLEAFYLAYGPKCYCDGDE